MRAELEAAIAADPEAREPYLVYSDWLQQQGDPLGEWIALHCQDPLPEEAMDDLRQKQGAEILGPALTSPHPLLGVDFRYGMVSKVGCHGDIRAETPPPFDAFFDWLQQLAAHPIGRFIRMLHPEAWKVVQTDPLLPWLATVNPRLPLREVSYKRWGQSQLELSSLLDHHPDLEVVSVGSNGGLVVNTPPASGVRELSIAASFSPLSVLHLARGNWPRLESLSLFFMDEDHRSAATSKDLIPLFHGQGVPRLRTLRLFGSGLFPERDDRVADELWPRLLSSPLAKQIVDLRLGQGLLSERNLSLLRDNLEALPLLRAVDNLESSWPDPEPSRRHRKLQALLMVPREPAPPRPASVVQRLRNLFRR